MIDLNNIILDYECTVKSNNRDVVIKVGNEYIYTIKYAGATSNLACAITQIFRKGGAIHFNFIFDGSDNERESTLWSVKELIRGGHILNFYPISSIYNLDNTVQDNGNCIEIQEGSKYTYTNMGIGVEIMVEKVFNVDSETHFAYRHINKRDAGVMSIKDLRELISTNSIRGFKEI